MQGRYITNVTPQSKAVNVNNKFGNTNIKNQQGTTRVLFDTLPLDGRTEFRFFENSNTRTLPYTNLTADGNRLQVGETFVIQKIYFQILNINADLPRLTEEKDFSLFVYEKGSIANGPSFKKY